MRIGFLMWTGTGRRWLMIIWLWLREENDRLIWFDMIQISHDEINKMNQDSGSTEERLFLSVLTEDSEKTDYSPNFDWTFSISLYSSDSSIYFSLYFLCNSIIFFLNISLSPLYLLHSSSLSTNFCLTPRSVLFYMDRYLYYSMRVDNLFFVSFDIVLR